MTFDEWSRTQCPVGDVGRAYQRWGWNGRQPEVENLTQLVLRLSQSLRKAEPTHDLPAKALDYLQREGLCGSPLREEPGTPALPA